jgi:serine/threonine protein kinase
VSQVKQILDEYRLEGVVKTSVCTTVFKAVDPQTEGRVVIKLINPAGPVAEEVNRARFLRALELARSGSIRTLPRTLDFGFTPEDNAFLVTELIEPAVPLESIAGQPPSRIVSLLVDVLDGADQLAMAGSAHLNLSPDNVLVVGDTVRIVGFGTGAYLAGAPSGVWPVEGSRYAAPELAGGVLRQDDLWLADLYSMALMACDLLGVEVYEAGTPEPRVRVPGVGAAGAQQFESLAAVALRGDPASRTVAISELRRALVKSVFPAVEAETVTAEAEPVDIDKTLRIPIPLPTDLTDADADMAGDDDTPVPTSRSAVSETVVAPMPPPPPAEPPAATAKPAKPTVEPQRVPTARIVKEVEPDPAAQTQPSAEPRARADVPWRLVGAAVAAVVLLVVVTAVIPTGGPRRGTEPVVEPVAQLPTPTAVPTPRPVLEAVPAIHPLLEEAERHLADGDLEGAQAVFEALTDDEIDQFSERENEIYETVLDAVEGTDRNTALRDLRGGLKAGSIRMLRRAVAGLADLDQAEIQGEPGLREDLDHARNALATHERLWTANKEENHVAVLEHARAMIALLPDYSGAYRLRDEAASAIDAQAEQAISARDYGAALELLEGIHRFWPEREGLVERMEWCRLEQAADRSSREQLDRALAAAAGGDPESGLQILARAKPSAGFVERFDEARIRLERQLEAMDAGSPEIVIPQDAALEFKKGDSVVVPIQVTDDYQVARVTVHFRSKESEQVEQRDLAPSGGGVYRFEVLPEMHLNKDFLFWVVAVDRGGHEGRLGSPDEPLVLDRKRWYRR